MVIRYRTAKNVDPSLRGGAVSIGNFDGVHRGHAALLSRLRAMADQLKGPAIAVTFDPPPSAILRPGVMPPQLTTIPRRAALIEECGIDHVIVYETDWDLLQQSPQRFFTGLIVDGLGARGMVEGPNFFFGKNRAGDTRLLKQLCRGHDIELEIVEPQKHSQSLISSTRVRELILAGDVERANLLLTQPFQISGTVVSGAARGREIGFPTANLAEISTIIPGPGVYACRVWLASGCCVHAATNIGPNPTFDDAGLKVEVHLIGFDGNLYGQTLALEFLARVRDVARFDSAEALVRQLSSDVRWIDKFLSSQASE